MPALEVRGLEVVYETPSGPLRAVDTVDLTIGRGRIVGLVGESGCGKSTLATALLGLTRRPVRVLGGTLLLGGGPTSECRVPLPWPAFGGGRSGWCPRAR